MMGTKKNKRKKEEKKGRGRRTEPKRAKHEEEKVR